MTRRFTSKEELFAAVTQSMAHQIRHELEQAPVGEVTGAVRTKIEIYERWGDEVVHRLTQEQRTPAIRAVTEGGRRAHYAWVERVLGPLLADRPTDVRRHQLAQLIAVTDLYVWKVLRRDLGLSREETERAMRDLVQRITDPG
jgi:AcrR family transcriptional regulator